MSVISSTLSNLSPWIAGVIGGLSANIAANWVWRKYTKPVLEFEKTAETDFEVDNNENPEARRFKMLVHNNGKTAAKNCKPEIQLKGKYGHSLFDVKRAVCWAEGDHPARITINPGETAEFEFFKIVSEIEKEGVIKTERSFYVQFPNSAGDDPTCDVVEWRYDEEFVAVQGAKFHDRIDKDLFEAIEWEENNITVTSENTDRIDGYVTLDSEVENAQGLIGMNVSIIPK